MVARLLLLLLSADPYQVPDEIRQQPRLPEAMSQGAEPLALQDAIAVAVRQNLGIQLTREQAVAADAAVRVQYGRFEPSLNALYSHSDADTPPPLTLLTQGVSAVQLNTVGDAWNVNLSERLQTGTTLGVGWTNARTLTTPGQDFPLLYNSGLQLTLTQPLLKGFA